MIRRDPKRVVAPVINRTLHTYSNTLRILCEAFQVEHDGARDCRAERQLVDQAFKLNRAGKMLVPIIDGAQGRRKMRRRLQDRAELSGIARQLAWFG